MLDRVVATEGEPQRAASAWSMSGCQAISDPRCRVPTRLVHGVHALISELDRRGAGLGADFAGDGLGLLAERAAALLLGRSGRDSCNGVSRLVATADGWLAVTLARSEDRRLLPAWLGVDPNDRVVTTNANPWAVVERAVACRPSAELIEMAALLGLACSAVGEQGDLRPVHVEASEGTTPPSLSGLRVVNLGSLWAGPLCADVLRRLGADVVCVESLGRPDGARATPRWFDAIHQGQRSVAIDFETRHGRQSLWKLLASADVVIEGSRPRALEHLGVDALTLLATERTAVWVSITGYGRDAGSAMRVGMGDDAAAAGGLLDTVDGSPIFLLDAVADPITGLIAATSVIDQLDAGQRALLDIALSRSAALFAQRPGDPVVEMLGEARPARPRQPASRPFTLGAETTDVLTNWLA